MFGWNTISDIFFCYIFTIFWFNFIIFVRCVFNVFVIFFIFMFIAQVSCTTISITWIIIIFTFLIISTTNLALLIFTWWGRFFFKSIILCTFSLLLGLSDSWIHSFPLIKISMICLFLSCERYVICLEIQLLYLIHVQTYLKHLECHFLIFHFWILFLLVVAFWYFYEIKWLFKLILFYLVVLICLLFQFFQKLLNYPMNLIYSMKCPFFIHFYKIYLF